MTKEELENNLGTIAKSGSLTFKKENDLQDDVDIIGQFGVGFYAAFMVSSEVTVISSAFGSDEAYRWNSSGADGYTIEPCTKDSLGTDVILKIKENTEEEKFRRVPRAVPHSGDCEKVFRLYPLSDHDGDGAFQTKRGHRYRRC